MSTCDELIKIVNDEFVSLSNKLGEEIVSEEQTPDTNSTVIEPFRIYDGAIGVGPVVEVAEVTDGDINSIPLKQLLEAYLVTLEGKHESLAPSVHRLAGWFRYYADELTATADSLG